MFVMEPRRAIFSGKTNTGKTKLALDLIETEYKIHFENIVIICPTIMYNDTYLERSWIWTDDDIVVSIFLRSIQVNLQGNLRYFL